MSYMTGYANKVVVAVSHLKSLALLPRDWFPEPSLLIIIHDLDV
jgi:hypothetical protein